MTEVITCSESIVRIGFCKLKTKGHKLHYRVENLGGNHG